MNELFFELIRISLGTQVSLSRQPSSEEWAALLDMATKQSLAGVCFAGIQKICDSDNEDYYGMTEFQYFTWMSLAVQIQQKNEIMNQQCVELQTKFAAGGLRSSILKGQGVANLYSEHISGLRQSGDIDLYVDCGRKKSFAYLESLGIKDLKWDYVHTHVPFFNDTEVEVHYRVSAVRNVWKNKGLQKFWKKNEEDFFGGVAVLPCGEIVCPSEKMHLLYLIHHAYRHLISGGIGLRQIMDIYFALLHRDTTNDDWLKEQVNSFGMNEFVKAMMWVMCKAFDISMIGMPWPSDEYEGSFLLNEIMIGGNFGKDDKRFGEGRSRFAILKQVMKRNCHLMSHYGSDAFAAPFYYVWHYCWKRLHR